MSPLFFVHIPKTAGTSLRLALAAALQDRLVPAYPNAPEPRWELDAVTSSALADDAVLFGHFYCDLHLQFGHAPRYAAVLRHPVERLHSWYRYVRRQPAHPWGELARTHAIADLVGKVPVLDNHMTRLLSARRHDELSAAAAHPVALRQLEGLEFVGLTEGLEADMPRLEALLGVRLPPLERHNSTEGDLLANSDRRAILDANQYDIALYERAQQIVLEARAGDAR